jgi:hypothetical protein
MLCPQEQLIRVVGEQTGTADGVGAQEARPWHRLSVLDSRPRLGYTVAPRLGITVVLEARLRRDVGEIGGDDPVAEAPRAKHIVTNPPYGAGLADRFIRQALALTAKTGGKVAMLLNLASLCDNSRDGKGGASC